MVLTPCEYDANAITFAEETSEVVATVAAGTSSAFTVSIPAKTGFVPVAWFCKTFTSSGSAVNITPVPAVAMISNQSSTTLTLYGKNFTSSPITSVRANVTIMYVRK